MLGTALFAKHVQPNKFLSFGFADKTCFNQKVTSKALLVLFSIMLLLLWSIFIFLCISVIAPTHDVRIILNDFVFIIDGRGLHYSR